VTEKTRQLIDSYGPNDQLKIFLNPTTNKKCFICFGFDASFKPSDLEKVIKKYIKNITNNDVLYCPSDYENGYIKTKIIPEIIINDYNNLFGDKGVKK